MPFLLLKCENETKKIPFSGEIKLKDLLLKSGVHINYPCSGNGKCGKCAVKLKGAVAPPDEAERKIGKRLACRAVLLGDAEAELIFREDFDYIEFKTSPCRPTEDIAWEYAAAVDIGTTTVVVKLFSSNGNELALSCALNPQRAVSADVAGRIGASVSGKRKYLSDVIRELLLQMLYSAAQSAQIPEDAITEIVITGNTAMLYLLCGRDASSVAAYPFNADELFGRTVYEKQRRIYFPACVSAFVGADITCAVVASGMCDDSAVSLLCDIGTNGELALWKDGVLYVTSTPAGPAFEGGNISCGCGYVSGAIDKVCIADGQIKAHTVGDVPATGIAGSGLIDAVACFYELGYITDCGKLDSDLAIYANGKSVRLTQEDIRAFQLAKGALRAGLEALLFAAGIKETDVKRLYISGGFGNGLCLESVVKTGMIPASLSEKTVFIGNGALSGAAMMLFDKSKRAFSENTAKNAKHIELGGNPLFNKLFIENMSFRTE